MNENQCVGKTCELSALSPPGALSFLFFASSLNKVLAKVSQVLSLGTWGMTFGTEEELVIFDKWRSSPMIFH